MRILLQIESFDNEIWLNVLKKCSLISFIKRKRTLKSENILENEKTTECCYLKYPNMLHNLPTK